MGRGPGGRGVLGGGDALAGAGAGRLAACRDDGWRGEACASVSVAVAGTWDRVGRKKRISFFFFRGAARCRAGTRGVGRGASSDLSHAPRRSSRLPSLGLSLSRRPAGLAPWGAGLGAWGRGDGTRGGQSRGQRLASGVAAEAFGRRSIACGSVAAPRKRARDGRCGRTHVLLLRPLLGHLLELFHCGVGRAG